MAYQIEFTPAADRAFRKLERRAQQRIDKALSLLAENPRPPKAEFLKGKFRGYLRVRTGNFRIIYIIEDDRLVVCIVRIADRKDAYR